MPGSNTTAPARSHLWRGSVGLIVRRLVEPELGGVLGGELLTGFDYIHSAVDDHSRVAYSEVLPDEKGTTCAAFTARALAHFAALGAPVAAVLTDNHWSYSRSTDLRTVLIAADTEHWLVKAHCPWQNGKVERLNRTLATEWAYAQPYLTNNDRTAALAIWLQHYNTDRYHSAIGATPITRVSPT